MMDIMNQQRLIRPKGADSILDVLNSNAKWNDRIDEAFESLYSLLSRTDFYIQQEQILEKLFPGSLQHELHLH